MTTLPMHAHRTFAADERSVSEARRFVRGMLESWGASDLTETVVLLVSELVTNAVVHAGTPARLQVTLDGESVRVEVEDQHPSRGLPMVAEVPPDDYERGRGLLITATLASAWGVEYTSTSKRVWLRFDRETDAPGLETWAAAYAPAGEVEGSPDGTPEPPVERQQLSVGPVLADSDALGLQVDALVRLTLDDYLALAVERVRDRLSADAAYVLMVRDLEDEFEVKAVSGLPSILRGTALASDAPGAPDGGNPHLPVVLPDLGRTPVPFLADTHLRSLAVAPITAEGRVIGALAVGSNHVDGFSADESVLLQRLAATLAMATDRARLQALERDRRGWLTFLADAGDLLAGSLDQEMTMAITGQICVPQLAVWCAVHLDDSRGHRVLQQAWHEDEHLVGPLMEALAAESTDRLDALPDDAFRGEVLSIPLVARARQIGLLTLGRAQGDPLRGEPLLVAESVARRAAVAIDNARAHGELWSIGNALQRSLLPSSTPVAPGYDVGVVYEAAGEGSTAGGDFYDLFGLGQGRWCFVVGDVCGTGAEAAAVTGLARHTIRALAQAGFPTAAVLERLNTAILDEGERSRFLTVLCGTLQAEGGRVRMSFVSAGHPLPFVVRRAGGVEQIGRPQSLLGVLDQVSYDEESHLLERGDLLVAVTDGVLERRAGPRMLGEDGLAEELAHLHELSAQAVAERVRQVVADFVDEPASDDLAVLVIRMGEQAR
ncbi:MAG TPA: SpoIIE family protein phosphatase [Nocardioides sp.]|nr:SpoIIE family protein phosphatase [Nocardioides sp.]